MAPLWLFLGGIAHATAWYSKESIARILADQLVKERRDFLRHNFVSENVVREVDAWLRAEAREDVKILAHETFVVGTSPSSAQNWARASDPYHFYGISSSWNARDAAVVSFRHKRMVRWHIARLEECRVNPTQCVAGKRWKLSDFVKIVYRYIPEHPGALVVERILDLKKIKETLSDSVGKDEKFRSQLPAFETLDYSGAPPAYSSLAHPPRYESSVFTDKFLASEARVIYDVVKLFREKNDDRVAVLTNRLVSLMFANWVLDQLAALPNNYESGVAADLSRLARELKHAP